MVECWPLSSDPGFLFRDPSYLAWPAFQRRCTPPRSQGPNPKWPNLQGSSLLLDCDAYSDMEMGRSSNQGDLQKARPFSTDFCQYEIYYSSHLKFFSLISFLSDSSIFCARIYGVRIYVAISFSSTL